MRNGDQPFFVQPIFGKYTNYLRVAITRLADLRFFFIILFLSSLRDNVQLYIDLLYDLFLSFSHCDRTESSSFCNYRSVFEKGYKKNRMLFFIREMNFARNKIDTCCSLYEFQ